MLDGAIGIRLKYIQCPEKHRMRRSWTICVRKTIGLLPVGDNKFPYFFKIKSVHVIVLGKFCKCDLRKDTIGVELLIKIVLKKVSIPILIRIILQSDLLGIGCVLL